jgi:hypothetical protein
MEFEDGGGVALNFAELVEGLLELAGESLAVEA